LQLYQTGNYFQQGRFTGTIGADDDKKITFLNGKGERVQNNLAVIGVA
jgi:hypothetical protein